MRLKLAILAIAGVLFASASLYGAGNYYRVEQRSGVWWFVAPDGQLTLSMGVDNVSYRGDVVHNTTVHPYFNRVSKLYPTENDWAETELRRIRSWGFNTLGSWSNPYLWKYKMPYTVILDIATRSGASWLKGIPVDVYSPHFEATARRIAERECAPRAHDPNLVGYFSDNELRWGPDWRGKQNMLAMYLNLPSDSAGRQHAIEFLKKRYSGSLQKLNQAWGVHAESFDKVPSEASTKAFQADNSVFLGMVAERYFQVCAKAIHSADPNHLYLGAKFAGMPPEPVIRASSAADVVSVDIYSFDPRPEVKKIYKLSGRPVLVAEFAFRAKDSGLPNTKGAGPRVADQAARARAYTNFVTWLESLPEAVGFHWFEWCDEPVQGRFDGENSNYGLVNIKDQPYTEFVKAVKAANADSISVHHKLMK